MSGVTGWLVGIALAIALLLFAPAVTAFLGTLLLAAVWCIKIDREEYAVQVLDVEVPEVARRP